MPDGKLIFLIQAKVLPDHRAEILQALRETLPLTRAEAGCRAFVSDRAKGRSQHACFSWMR
jgi:quinol monooxygenase YgiN